MTKKSRRVAARQAEIGKEGKRRRRSQAYVAPVKPASIPSTGEVTASPTTSPLTTEAVARPRAEAALLRPIAPGLQYVTSELRRIAIIGGAMVLVLIILAIVL